MAASPEVGHGDLQNADVVSGLVWRIFRTGGALARQRNGELWKFATMLAEVKADADLLSPVRRGMILGMLAMHPCWRWSNLWVPAPNGTNPDVKLFGEVFPEQNTAMVIRPDRDRVYEFEFVNGKQADRVRRAPRATIAEDVSTTGSTAFHVAQFLRAVNPDLVIHSVSWLQRGEIRPEYTAPGPNQVVYHTLCRQDIPTEHAAFVAKFGFEPTLV
jgi:hypothetical protein